MTDYWDADDDQMMISAAESALDWLLHRVCVALVPVLQTKVASQRRCQLKYDLLTAHLTLQPTAIYMASCG